MRAGRLWLLGALVLVGACTGTEETPLPQLAVGVNWNYVAFYSLEQADAPELVLQVEGPGSVHDLVLVGDRLWFSGGDDQGEGIGYYDLSDPSNPTYGKMYYSLDTFSFEKAPKNMLEKDGRLFLSCDYQGLVIADVSGDAPELLGIAATLIGPDSSVHEVWAQDCAVDERGYAYVASIAGVDVIDVSDPESPRLVASVSTPSYHVCLNGNYLYATTQANEGSFAVIDVSDPESPTLVSQTTGRYGHMALYGNTLFVLMDDTLCVFDVSDPANPTLLGKGAYGSGGLNKGVLKGDYFYVSSSASSSPYLVVYDVSDPESPRVVYNEEIGAGLGAYGITLLE